MGNDPELGLILHSHSKRLLFETHVHHTSTWRCDPGTFLQEEYQQRVNHKPVRHRPSKDCEHIQNVLFNFNCDVDDAHG